MARATDGAGLDVVFQPIADAVSGMVVGYEALGRASTGAGYGPAELLDMAVCAGALTDLDRWWRKLAIEQVAHHHRHSGATFHLNVDARIVDEPTWNPGFLRRQLAAHELPPSRFVLELTERNAPLDSELLEALLPVYRELGFRIALDDVGVTDGGPGSAVHHRFDMIKIDRAVVGGIDADPARRRLVSSMGELCDREGIELVAEGVERAQELSVLRALGIRRVQGWHVGVPRPLSEMPPEPELARSAPARSQPVPPSPPPLRPARSSVH